MKTDTFDYISWMYKKIILLTLELRFKQFLPKERWYFQFYSLQITLQCYEIISSPMRIIAVSVFLPFYLSFFFIAFIFLNPFLSIISFRSLSFYLILFDLLHSLLLLAPYWCVLTLFRVVLPYRSFSSLVYKTNQ